MKVYWTDQGCDIPNLRYYLYYVDLVGLKSDTIDWLIGGKNASTLKDPNGNNASTLNEPVNGKNASTLNETVNGEIVGYTENNASLLNFVDVDENVRSMYISDLAVGVVYKGYLLHSVVGIGNGAPSEFIKFKTFIKRKLVD